MTTSQHPLSGEFNIPTVVAARGHRELGTINGTDDTEIARDFTFHNFRRRFGGVTQIKTNLERTLKANRVFRLDATAG